MCIYIYIYIYVCMYVCMYVCVFPVATPKFFSRGSTIIEQEICHGSK